MIKEIYFKEKYYLLFTYKIYLYLTSCQKGIRSLQKKDIHIGTNKNQTNNNGHCSSETEP